MYMYPNDPFGTGFCSKHTQNARPASHVQDNLVFEQVLIVVDGISIGKRSNFIFKHFLNEKYHNYLLLAHVFK